MLIVVQWSEIRIIWFKSHYQLSTCCLLKLKRAIAPTTQLYLPTNMAPSTSNIVPRIHACLIVNTLAPTEVPNAFATSLAPNPNANTNAMMKPTMTIHNQLSSYNIFSDVTNLKNEMTSYMYTKLKWLHRYEMKWRCGYDTEMTSYIRKCMTSHI